MKRETPPVKHVYQEYFSYHVSHHNIYTQRLYNYKSDYKHNIVFCYCYERSR